MLDEAEWMGENGWIHKELPVSSPFLLPLGQVFSETGVKPPPPLSDRHANITTIVPTQPMVRPTGLPARSAVPTLIPATAPPVQPHETYHHVTRPQVPVIFQSPGGPSITIKHLAAFTSGNSLVLVNQKDADATFRLPPAEASGPLAIRLPDQTDLVVDLRTAIEFEYDGKLFIALGVREALPPAVPDEVLEAAHEEEAPPEYLPEIEFEEEDSDPLGVLSIN